MKMTVNSYTWFILLLCSYSYGQMEQYDYKRELKGISDQWHNIFAKRYFLKDFTELIRYSDFWHQGQQGYY